MSLGDCASGGTVGRLRTFKASGRVCYSIDDGPLSWVTASQACVVMGLDYVRLSQHLGDDTCAIWEAIGDCVHVPTIRWVVGQACKMARGFPTPPPSTCSSTVWLYHTSGRWDHFGFHFVPVGRAPVLPSTNVGGVLRALRHGERHRVECGDLAVYLTRRLKRLHWQGRIDTYCSELKSVRAGLWRDEYAPQVGDVLNLRVPVWVGGGGRFHRLTVQAVRHDECFGWGLELRELELRVELMPCGLAWFCRGGVEIDPSSTLGWSCVERAPVVVGAAPVLLSSLLASAPLPVVPVLAPLPTLPSPADELGVVVAPVSSGHVTGLGPPCASVSGGVSFYSAASVSAAPDLVPSGTAGAVVPDAAVGPVVVVAPPSVVPRLTRAAARALDFSGGGLAPGVGSGVPAVQPGVGVARSVSSADSDDVPLAVIAAGLTFRGGGAWRAGGRVRADLRCALPLLNIRLRSFCEHGVHTHTVSRNLEVCYGCCVESILKRALRGRGPTGRCVEAMKGFGFDY